VQVVKNIFLLAKFFNVTVLLSDIERNILFRNNWNSAPVLFISFLFAWDNYLSPNLASCTNRITSSCRTSKQRCNLPDYFEVTPCMQDNDIPRSDETVREFKKSFLKQFQLCRTNKRINKRIYRPVNRRSADWGFSFAGNDRCAKMAAVLFWVALYICTLPQRAPRKRCEQRQAR